MHQLPSTKWEPSDILNIITPGNDIGCAGTTQQGLPCRWRLDGEIKAQIRSFLVHMSEKSPRRAIDDLPELARLCLCETNHRSQQANVVNKWTLIVKRYALWMESRDAQELESNPDDIPSSPPKKNGQPSRPRPASPDLDDLADELEALDIRRRQVQENIRRRLAETDIQTSNSSLVQSSPSPSTPSLAISTPQEELPSNSQQSLGRGSSPPRNSKKWVFGRRKD
jgi:hypothetical protein